MINFQLNGLASPERALFHHAVVNENIAQTFLCVSHTEHRTISAADHTMISGLSAAFAIERRLVDQYRAALAFIQRGYILLPSMTMARIFAFGLLGVIAEEFCAAHALADIKPKSIGFFFAGAFPGSPRIGFLFGHRFGKRLTINRNAARFERVLGEIKRETKRVI